MKYKCGNWEQGRMLTTFNKLCKYENQIFGVEATKK